MHTVFIDYVVSFPLVQTSTLFCFSAFVSLMYRYINRDMQRSLNLFCARCCFILWNTCIHFVLCYAMLFILCYIMLCYLCCIIICYNMLCFNPVFQSMLPHCSHAIPKQQSSHVLIKEIILTNNLRIIFKVKWFKINAKRQLELWSQSTQISQLAVKQYIPETILYIRFLNLITWNWNVVLSIFCFVRICVFYIFACFKHAFLHLQGH